MFQTYIHHWLSTAAGYSVILHTTIVVFAITMILTVYEASTPDNRVRGRRGERKVARILDRIVRRHPGEYFLVNNLIIQDERHSSEIDHVLVAPKAYMSLKPRRTGRFM